MKLKELEGCLGEIHGFRNPKVKLEQYATQPHIAARILHTIHSHFDDLEGKVLLDLGCGTGVFLIGASLLGAGSCVGIDVDELALETCLENCQEFEAANVDLIRADVTELTFQRSVADVVITNPPFGTKHNQGMDMKFLKQALALADTAVYSLHKTATRAHIEKKAADWKVKMEVLAELRFDLPATYRFHKHDSRDVAVDFIRFSHGSRGRQ